MAERVKTRCGWAAAGGPLDVEYHDREWGVPLHDDKLLFEFLILEGAQAGRPLVGRRRTMQEVPPRTELSDRISGELRHRGFRVVGSTIVYAYLQAVGVVNDHQVTCYRYRETLALS